ncbi:hypothetical protein ABEB36_004669 [Hypothenemus hampei]|uniref:F-box domain-containing protein n=1 Tax=Hypothenemus hampei TaxID=57062 RepID=A0ABD1F6Q7_HYPHA
MAQCYPYSFSLCNSPKYVLAFNETITNKNHGAWAQRTSIAQESYKEADTDPFSSDDFLHVDFKKPIDLKHLVVDPRWIDVIYRMWGFTKNTINHNRSPDWKLLYVAPQSRDFATRHFEFSGSVTEIRLEFNKNFGIHCFELINFMDKELIFSIPPIDYNIPKNKWMKDAMSNFMSNVVPQRKPITKSKGKNLIDMLPTETMCKIFEHLDLVSLSRCAQVNKRWNEIASDPYFYRDIDLKIK